MKPSDITPLTEGPARWQKAIDSCETFEELDEVLAEWRELCPDAYEDRPKTAEEFDFFRKGLLKERKGKFAGAAWAERFGTILIPAELLEVSLIAERFFVPWGLAWLRRLEAKKQDVERLSR